MVGKKLGQIFGWTVIRTETNYVFGCGAVKIPVKTVHNFLRELTVRQTRSKALSKQEVDYYKVIGIIQDRGYFLDEGRISQIFNVLGNGKTKAKILPAKKAAPKKAAKKK